MSGPGWLADVFAGVMVLVAASSAGRLGTAQLQSRRTHVDVDIAHVLMGAAMAGMLVSAINLVQARVWEVLFAVLALWFLWRCYDFVRQHGLRGRDADQVHYLSHYATHEVMALAMLYMYFAAATPSGASANDAMPMSAATGSAADFVGLPLLFLVVLFASGIWELDGIERLSPDRVRRMPEPAFASAGGAAAEAPGEDRSNGPFLLGDDQFPGRGAQRAQWLAPRLEAACHIAMCITMGYMLIVML